MKAEFDRLQQCADRSFLVHAMQDTDSYFDKIVFDIVTHHLETRETL